MCVYVCMRGADGEDDELCSLRTAVWHWTADSRGKRWAGHARRRHPIGANNRGQIIRFEAIKRIVNKNAGGFKMMSKAAKDVLLMNKKKKKCRRELNA